MKTKTMNFSFTRISGNSKTGPIPVSMTARNSCPDTCKLKSSGCYASAGMVALHWRKLDNAGLNLETFTQKVKELPKGQLWRHNIAGDIPSDERGYMDAVTLEAIVAANKGLKGFTYTHCTLEGRPGKANSALIKWACNNGFTVNVSADSPMHADRLAQMHSGPIVCMLPEWKEGDAKHTTTPSGKSITVCPAVTTPGVTCQLCQLCQKADRKAIVGFPVHGTAKNKARAIMMKAA